ncbi:hypothetical protein [Nitratiruptor sp. YY09-18]|uniref:hypothetical protein n=1 Tax=Nitratiruptor sp. YY09-18 TaxID=2724901 RepID=UPI0019161725|nr:hypothetical protein [Nitratiruptor sp. YY09-18]BCD67881.1 hypothetical protein NitYY0918_C0788 [Nitratiruptor sp. YY09-18]
MFKSFAAALSIFFSSIFSVTTPQTPTQNMNNPSIVKENTTITTSTNYFYYIDPTHIKCKVDIGDNRSIDTSNAKRNFYITHIQLTGSTCQIEDLSIQDNTLINDQENLEFTATLAGQCMDNQINFSAKKIIENVVIANGKMYKGKKEQKIGPLTLLNKYPSSYGTTGNGATQNSAINLNSKYKIALFTQDDNFLLKANDEKAIIYQIVDRNGNEIEEGNLQSLFIKSYNGLAIKIVDNNGTLHNEYTIDSPTVDGEFVLKSFDRAGEIPLKIKATIKVGEVIGEVSREFFVTVAQLPTISYDLMLSFDHDNLIIDKAEYLNYAILSPSTNNYIPADQIKSIQVESTTSNAVCVDENGNEVQNYTIPLSQIKNHGFFYVAGKKRGLASFKVTVDLQNGKRLTKFISTHVDYTYDNKIALEYAGTEYNKTSGFFIDTYTIKLKDTYYNGKILHVSAINPKIDYEYYYNHFFSTEFDHENPYVYYDGIDDGAQTGRLEGNETLGYTYFTSTRYELNKSIPNDDKLLILPNLQRNSTNYLGSWEIVDATDDNKLYLQQYFDVHEEGLSFVIGNEQRLNPIQDTFAAIFLDHRNGEYVIDNNQVQIKLYYPNFFAGKDIFIGAYVGDGVKREGNSFKRTLTGTALAQPELMKCNTSPCSQIVQLNFKDSNQHLELSRFGVRCKMDQARYYYFTPVSVPCASDITFGQVHTQKTNGNGDVKLCIYPEPAYKEVQEGNQTYRVQDGFEEVQPECTFTVSEEFPY